VITSLPTPLAAFVDSTVYAGPVLIMAWVYDEDTHGNKGCYGLCVDDEGRLMQFAQVYLRVDIRYDWSGHKWVDVNGVTDDDEEEPAPDGGTAVP
jgi:hypothetical protein